jgi:cysteine synthase A
VRILDHIGGTRLVPLRYLTAGGAGAPASAPTRILLKLEYENPTGSMKDRMALAMVEAAQADGRLKPGGSVVEYTGGSTGVSLSFVCAAKRIPLQIVTSDAFSKEKRDHMEALGAKLTLIHSPTGGTTKALTLEMIEAARQLATAPGSYWTDQLNNTDQLAAYLKMGDEIWEQSGGRVDAYVQSVGTCGSLRGGATRLRELNPALHAVAVEPEESPALSGKPTGSHGIEGIGIGYAAPLWSGTPATGGKGAPGAGSPGAVSLVNEIETVSTQEAMEMARRLAREEGIFAGTSTGANVTAALRLARRLPPGSTIVTLAVDTGMKYLSTELYGRRS